VLLIFISTPIILSADEENKDNSIIFSVLDYDKLSPIKGAKISIGNDIYTTNESGILEIKRKYEKSKGIPQEIKISHPDYYTDFPEFINLDKINELNFLLIPNSLFLNAKGKVIIPPEKQENLIVGIFIPRLQAKDSDPDWKKWEPASNTEYIFKKFKSKIIIKEKEYKTYAFPYLIKDDGYISKVDKEGNFSISFIPIKKVEHFKIIASAPNFGFSELIIPQDKLEDITLTLSKDGGLTVAGRIVDTNNKPIIGAKLTCEYTRFSTKTDNDGKFSISNCWPFLFYFDIKPGKDLEAESIFIDHPYYRPYAHAGEWDNLKIVSYPRKTRNIEDFSKIDEESSNYKKFNDLAIGNLSSGKYHEVIDNLSKAISLNTTETVSSSLINRALAYIAIGNINSAYNDCCEALIISPTSPYISFIAGWIEFLTGKYELAEKHFSNAVIFGNNQDNNMPYYTLGLYLSSIANGKEDKKHLENTKILEQNKIKPLFDLIINNSNESDIEKALNFIDEEEKMDIYFYFGEIYKLKSDRKKAQEYFENTIRLKKFNTIEHIIATVELKILKENIANLKLPQSNISHTVLFDFEKEENSDIFNPTQGGLSFSISPLPESLPETIDTPPSRKTLKITSPAKGFLYTKKNLLPENLIDYSYLTFWAYNSSNNKPVFEVQFIEERGIAKFWRKIEITKKGWTKITIPLRFMRQSENKTPSWKKVKYLGLFFRDAADLYIDNLTFIQCPKKTAVLLEEELAEIAFPLTQKSQIQKLIKEDYIIITNSQELEFGKLENKINEFFFTIKKDFEGIKKSKPDSPPILIIFANEEEYRNFTPRLAFLSVCLLAIVKAMIYPIWI